MTAGLNVAVVGGGWAGCAAAAELARPGRAYVLDHYTWPITLDRMEASLNEMAGRS